jgi:hypothetical protein
MRRAAAIHGDMDQHSRMEVLHGFKAAKYHVLVATDVAARGLDIKSIKTVRSCFQPLKGVTVWLETPVAQQARRGGARAGHQVHRDGQLTNHMNRK